MFDAARIVDDFIDTSCTYSFDRMLVPNRIYKFLSDKAVNSCNYLLTKHFDKCLYVINTIYRRYQIAFNIAKKCHWSIDLSKWAIPIYSKVYNTVLGTDYLKYVNLLVDLGVINRDSSYMKGTADVKGRCKHYWFTSDFLQYTYDYLNSKYLEEAGYVKHRKGGVRVIKVTDRSLYRHLAKHAADVKEEQLSIPLINELYNNLKHFHFDEEQSEQVLDNLVANGDIPLERKNDELNKVKTFNSYLTNPYALYCKRDEYGRVHTNVTQLKKEVRKNCLYCDGKPTVGIDIKSSQGAFLYTVLKKYINYILYENQEHIVNLYSLDVNKFRNLYFNSDMLLAESCDFKRLLDNGCLYEFFMHHLIDDYGFSDIDRAFVKKEFLTCLFCGKYFSQKKHMLVSSIQAIWNTYFPTLYQIILIIKSDNYAALAHDLQRTESHLVFNIVYNRIKAEIGCPVCTVHDSIIVEEQYGERVKQIFDEALKAFDVPTFTEIEYMELSLNTAFNRKV